MRIACAVVVAAACGHSTKTAPPASEQSFQAGVQVVCDVPEHVPEAAQPEQRLAGAGRWLDEHVTNADARKLGDLKALSIDKEQLADAAQRAGIARCKLLDNGMALQSFADGLRALCDAPLGTPEQSAAYAKSHFLNPEVIRMIASLGQKSPPDMARTLRDATARAGITECAALARFAKTTVAEVPKVTAAGLADADPTGPMLVATERGIVVDGKAIVAIDHGAVPPDELEGGALGMRIVRLHDYLAQQPHDRPLQLAFAPSLPYRLLVQVVYTASKAGIDQVALLVDAGAPKTLAVGLPPKLKPGEKRSGVGMIVSITRDKLLLWSVTGAEGSLQKPKLTATQPAELTPVARDIAARRHDQTIIVMADAEIPMQRVAEVMAAVHDAFPTIRLSSGFE